MKKRTILIIVGLVLAVGLFFGGRSVYYEFYPVPREPSAEWEPFVSALDAQREAFFVENDGIKIEAELFIPNGGEEQKPAVVYRPEHSLLWPPKFSQPLPAASWNLPDTPGHNRLR